MNGREVEIFSLELGFWEPPLAGISVRCSSGTYIRSLARDIALAAGSRASLAALRRTHVAGFSLEEAVSPEDGDRFPSLLPVSPGLFDRLGMPRIELGPDDARKVAAGSPLDRLSPLNLPTEESAAALFCQNNLLAVLERQGPNGNWRYGYVYARD